MATVTATCRTNGCTESGIAKGGIQNSGTDEVTGETWSCPVECGVCKQEILDLVPEG